MTVPDILTQWFDGKSVLAEGYGLQRLEVRWKVTEVLGINTSYILDGETREYKIYEAAKATQDRWAKEGRVALLQCGVLLWLTEDEVPRGSSKSPTVDQGEQLDGHR